MRLFLWPLVLILALVLGFGAVIAPLVEQRKPHYRLPVHKTIYLEGSVYDEQLYHILRATMEWNEATNGQVSFDIQRLPQRNLDPTQSIVIMNVSPGHPQIILLDMIDEWNTLGYTGHTGPLTYILLVDQRIDDASEESVIMHELGHALGMQHIEGIAGIGTLMYPTTDFEARHITDTDLWHFCQLYHCDSRQFHGLP